MNKAQIQWHCAREVATIYPSYVSAYRIVAEVEINGKVMRHAEIISARALLDVDLSSWESARLIRDLVRQCERWLMRYVGREIGAPRAWL